MTPTTPPTPSGGPETGDGLTGWHVEHDDPEQPPRLVWWHREHADAAVIDVDDVLMSIEERCPEGDLATLSEQAITDLCDLVSRASHAAADPDVPLADRLDLLAAEHPCSGHCLGCGAGSDESCSGGCECDLNHNCGGARCHTLHAVASSQHVGLRVECPWADDDPARPCRTFSEREAGSDPSEAYGPEIPGCGVAHWLAEEIDAVDAIDAGRDGSFDLPAEIDVEWDSLDECWVIRPAAPSAGTDTPEPSGEVVERVARAIRGELPATQEMDHYFAVRGATVARAALAAAPTPEAPAREGEPCCEWHGPCDVGPIPDAIQSSPEHSLYSALIRGGWDAEGSVEVVEAVKTHHRRLVSGEDPQGDEEVPDA